MSKKFLIISVVLISIGLVFMAASVSYSQTSNEFTVPLTNPSTRGTLKAHLNYGSITVSGTARKDVLVRYKPAAEEDDDRDSDGSRQGLRRIGGGGMDLEVTENNNNVTVKSGSWNHKVDLEIEIPSGMDINLHTYNGGDLMVSNIQGELSLSNYNGEITALNISGSAVASTYNGDVKVTFDRVTEGTPMSFTTFNGDVDLTFPSAFKASFKMKTEQGEIFTGFDVNIKSSGPVQMKDTKGGVYKVVVDDWKQADVNGGGPEITIKNYNGDILIRKK